MPLTRLLLIVLLALAVPFAATARMLASQPAAASTMQHAHAGMDNMHECCMTASNAAHDQNADHGCKSGAECKLCQACAVVTAATTLQHFPMAAQRLPDPPMFTLPAHDPRGLWRPPRTI